MQNNFCTNFRMIPVFGLTPAILQYVFNTFDEDGNKHQTTIQHYILSQEPILGMEATNCAADMGKTFLISDATHILEAPRAFVDTIIPELFASGVILPELIHPNFTPPSTWRCQTDIP
jgi:hypothetical protein